MKLFTCNQKEFVLLEHELTETKKIVAKKLEPYIRHWNYKLL